MTIKAIFLSGILCLLLPVLMQAQGKIGLDDTDTQASVKASYLFQFSKYTDWPDATKQGNFVIGVAGNTSLYNILVNKYANKAIGSQLLQIVEIKETGSIPEIIHILYINEELSNDLPKYIKALRKKPSLVVTEIVGAMDQGAHINFLQLDGIIRFEINDTKSQESGVSFSDKLKGWAIKLK